MSSPHESTADYTPPSVDPHVVRHSYNPSAARSPETGSSTSQQQLPAAPTTTPGSPPSVAGKPPVKPAPARISLSAINLSLPLEERGGEVQRLAIEAFSQCDNWVIFYREILGSEGVLYKLFPKVEQMRFWEQSQAFGEVHTMLAAIRSQDTGKGETVETQRMITVRLPMSMHETLKRESKDADLSINKLCITKLLQCMDSRFVPTEPGKRRGRKPGPQGKRSLKESAAVVQGE